MASATSGTPWWADVTDDEVGVLVASRQRIHRRTVWVALVLAAVLFAVCCASISLGEFPIPLRDVLSYVFGQGGADSSFIIGRVRLPRTLTGAVVGVAFGVSGAIFQSLAHNPLASPDIIGITAGSSAAAVFMLLVVGAGGLTVSIGAFAGSVLTAAAVYVLAYRRGVSAYRLILVGIAVGAILGALTTYMLSKAEVYDAQRATVWLTGSLNGRGWDEFVPVAVAVAVLLPIVALLARGLRTMQLGDDTAAQLGLRVEATRGGLVVAGCALAAFATAAAGPIVFVAFIAPAIARRLTRTPLTLVASGLVGALLLVASDLIARRLFAPVQLPVGIVTGVIGGPYLLWLLWTTNKIGAGG